MMTFVTNPMQEIERLYGRVRDLEGQIAKAQADPAPCGTVIEVGPTKSTVIVGGSAFEIFTPSGVKVTPGDRVHVHSQSRGIIDVIKDPYVTGPVRVVSRVLDSRHVELDGPMGGASICLYHGDPPRKDDRVVLDPSNSIVIRNIGRAKEVKAPVDTGVDWDDIGGQAEAKRLLRNAIEGPIVDRALRKAYRKTRSKGALLAGPTGTGKTLLGKACATALARLHGAKSTGTGFQYSKGPELLQPLVGNSEAGVRALFSNARAHFEEHGYPCVIFLDEGDALLGRRDTARFTGMEKTIVPMFLTELDGFDDSCAFFVVATNRPDMLDPAVTREGRLDLKILVSRPNRTDMLEILGRHLADRPLDGMSVEEACEVAVDQILHVRHALYVVRMKDPKDDRRFTLGSLVSGAMLAGLVERAADLAIDRDKAAKRKEPGGISAVDFAAAADALRREQGILDHASDLESFVEESKANVRSIERITP